jgi:membrane protein required for colicin V production
MTWADWAILGLLVFAIFGGMVQGFLRSVFALGGLLLGLVLASWNYDRVGRFILPAMHSESIIDAVGFLVTAIVVMLAAAVVGAALQRMFHWAGLGCLDTLLGGIFGFLQGALLVMVFVLVTVAFFPGSGWLTGAKLPPLFFEACHLSMDMSPKQLGDQVQDGVKKLKKETPAWMHPGHGTT